MLQRLADGEIISDADRQAVFDHVRRCDQCLRGLRYVTALTDVLRTAEDAASPWNPPAPAALLDRIVRTMAAERAPQTSGRSTEDDPSSGS